MVNKLTKANSKDLERELQWFRAILDTRFKLYFGQEAEQSSIYDIAEPEIKKAHSPWAVFIKKYKPSFEERLAILLALIPHIQPRILDIFFTKNQQYDRPFTEFGGITDAKHPGFLPTGQTLLFLLAGHDLEKGFSVHALFQSDHYLISEHILSLEGNQQNGIPLSGQLHISAEYLTLFTLGTTIKPAFSIQFPAQEIKTALDWSDLVLHPKTRTQIEEIATWIKHGDTLLHNWGMADKIRPGYRSLFYGPPGTGKSMTARLLGKTTGHSVYRIDLSMVVSKYIGETEKNLSRVFDQAERKDWILFFDEADALFGKRSETRTSNDRYANQEVAYLLQRIEGFNGILILATNFKENVDEAFSRRFESIIHFPIPNAEQRLQLWDKGIPKQAKLAQDVDLSKLAQRFELTGGAIINVIRFASMEALEKGGNILTLASLTQGIRRELLKEGRVV